ncbi:hypothetical protein UFOVP434_90 [uncultured Caudovirales phage]|uniref:Uncharacterized protein n=1 Tax=uncultured Caudovirales phage TaxID=2100421 RepID=A0A6J5M929_9CAUD|nr:hypothetical protein UFOVP434_90 [uncultured Caudovirales phage]
MDPNEVLKDLMSQVRAVLKNETRHQDNIVSMAEKVMHLDQWLKDGGFLPNRWVSRR